MAICNCDTNWLYPILPFFLESSQLCIKPRCPFLRLHSLRRRNGEMPKSQNLTGSNNTMRVRPSSRAELLDVLTIKVAQVAIMYVHDATCTFSTPVLGLAPKRSLSTSVDEILGSHNIYGACISSIRCLHDSKNHEVRGTPLTLKHS